MIAGPVVFLLALAVSIPLLLKCRDAVQAHRRAVATASILLAGVALLTLTASVIAGGWSDADGGYAYTDYFPGHVLMPEGTGYNAKPTLLPVGVQCTFTASDGRDLSVGPTNWWLSLPALTAGAVAISALLTVVSQRAAGAGCRQASLARRAVIPQAGRPEGHTHDSASGSVGDTRGSGVTAVALMT